MGITVRLDNLRDRIDAADEMSDDDAAILQRFDDRMELLATDYSDHRREKLLRHCTRMAEEVGGLADALDDRDAAERIVAWINRTYDNEETNRDYRTALRVCGRRVKRLDEPPESLAWVSTATSSNYDPSPDPRDMLDWEDEVVPMIESCFNNRDRAMIALQFDAGLRGGEFEDLRYGDIQDHKYGLQVTAEGKQGRRTVTLIPSVSYVRQWLRDHPSRARDDALWTRIKQPAGISTRMINKVFKEAAARVDVEKPVTPTNFRKSSAAFLASRNLNQAHIEDHHGWVRGSRVAGRYISVFGEASERELARLHGLDVSADDPEPIGPIVCSRCERETPRHEALCVWCGQVLDPEAAAELDAQQRRQRKTNLELEPPEQKVYDKILDAIEADPEIRSRSLRD